jgi:hypothetical protein
MRWWGGVSLDQERAAFDEWVDTGLKPRLAQLRWTCDGCGTENDMFRVSCQMRDCSGKRLGKLRLFVRHGEGVHNTSVWKAIWTRDAMLTEKGEAQALSLGRTLKGVPVDQVVVSPMRRAIQTAVGIFGEDGPNFALSSVHSEYFEPRAQCNLGSEPSVLVQQFGFLKYWSGFDELEREWWPSKESDVNWEEWRTQKCRNFLW